MSLDATKFGPSCPQDPDYIKEGAIFLPNQEMSENCLHLNLYVPKMSEGNSSKSVMVFIHGGGYIFGQGMFYESSKLSIDGNVIVVTINYRLGYLGFLCTDDKNSRGNYGIWDQLMALQWIHQNIRAFGGNRNSVTLFGESAGAYSIGLLTMIPSNRGLFQRVILQSGSVLSEDAIEETDGLAIAKEFAVALNCNDTLTTAGIVDCIKFANLSDIINKTVEISRAKSLFEITVRPCIDKELFTESPKQILKNRNSLAFAFYQSLDMIIGSVSAEGSFTLSNLQRISMQNMTNFNYSIGVPTSILSDYYVPRILQRFFNNNTRVKTVILEEYTKDNISEQGMSLINLYGDIDFYSPIVRDAESHDGPGNTFMYYFDYETPFSGLIVDKIPSWFRGTVHGLDLIFLFGFLDRLPFLGIQVSYIDKDIETAFISFWSSFAKTG